MVLRDLGMGALRDMAQGQTCIHDTIGLWTQLRTADVMRSVPGALPALHRDVGFCRGGRFAKTEVTSVEYTAVIVMDTLRRDASS
jgi:hypothetical protein